MNGRRWCWRSWEISRYFLSSANLLFLFLVFLGPLISVSSRNWVICWAGIEIRFLGLIPLLFLSNKYVSLTKESSMKYFCIQALGRGILFYSGLVFFSDLFSNTFTLTLVLGAMIKLGLFPFHFWVPAVVSGLDWMPIYLILTVQKVAPFAFLICTLRVISINLSLVIGFFAVSRAVVGGLIGNNQTDLRAILGSSSVAHSGWMTLGAIRGYFWGYFFIYCVSLLFVFRFLNRRTCTIETGRAILSLRGLPPFAIFIGKWGILKSAIEVGFPVWVISGFLLRALISLMFYLKFSYFFVLNNKGLLRGLERNPLFRYFLLANLSLLTFFLLV